MLDLNNDDIITNGNELFGPRTGNGFTELSVYDEDGNNWIDEKDLVYVITGKKWGQNHRFKCGQGDVRTY